MRSQSPADAAHTSSQGKSESTVGVYSCPPLPLHQTSVSAFCVQIDSEVFKIYKLIYRIHPGRYQLLKARCISTYIIHNNRSHRMGTTHPLSSQIQVILNNY